MRLSSFVVVQDMAGRCKVLNKNKVRHVCYQVDAPALGKRAGDFLRQKGWSRQDITELKKQGIQARLNGKVIFFGHRMEEEGCLEIDIPLDEESSEILPENLPFPVVYEDEDLVVVNKPAGMAVHPIHKYPTGSLGNAAMYYYEQQGRPFVFRPAHRLDKETSGLLVIAKHFVSASIFYRQLQEKVLQKEYLALVDDTLTAGISGWQQDLQKIPGRDQEEDRRDLQADQPEEQRRDSQTDQKEEQQRYQQADQQKEQRRYQQADQQKKQWRDQRRDQQANQQEEQWRGQQELQNQPGKRQTNCKVVSCTEVPGEDVLDFREEPDPVNRLPEKGTIKFPICRERTGSVKRTAVKCVPALNGKSESLSEPVEKHGGNVLTVAFVKEESLPFSEPVKKSVENDCSGETADRKTSKDTYDREKLMLRELCESDGETLLDLQEACTHFEVVQRMDGYSLVRLWLETGRTHQIRVHMAAVGHPLLGDKLYNPRWEQAAEPAAPFRHALHAFRLRFRHPITGEEMCFEAPLPEDLGAFVPEGMTLDG